MRILVCGGRDFANPKPGDRSSENNPQMDQYRFVHRTLDKLAIEYSKEYNPDVNWLPTDITIIEGNATGVDQAAGDWAICNYAKLEVFYADWAKYGKGAGLLRNIDMLERGKSDLVVAFPGGRGTAHMVGIAKKAGIKVIEVEYNES